jgi:predicted phosphodiesterase
MTTPRGSFCLYTSMPLLSVLAACPAERSVAELPVAAHVDQPVAQFWALGDTQFNNVLAISTRTHSAPVKAVAPGAIRPPTLDLWSEVVLDDIVAKTNADPSDASPVFFLGDGANTSCTGEYARFLNAMSAARWFGVLGNHDGFYMGNYTWAPDGKGADPKKKDTWSGACNMSEGNEGDQEVFSVPKEKLAALERSMLDVPETYTRMSSMPKALAVWLYLNDLHTRHVLENDPLERKSWEAKGIGFEFNADGKAPWDSAITVSVFAAVAKSSPHPKHPDKYKDSRAWKAFVVQNVKIAPNLSAFLIDTSDYETRPPSTFLERAQGVIDKCRMPGECGEVGKEQIDKLLSWSERAQRDGARFFVLGHHDWQSMSEAGRAKLRQLFASPAFITYISGHTHQPTAKGSVDANEYWELNVASVTDWPMEYVKVGWWPDGDAGNQLRVSTIPDSAHAPNGNKCPLVTSLNEGVEHDSELDYDTVEKYNMRAGVQYSRLLALLRTDSHAAERDTLEAACAECLTKYFNLASRVSKDGDAESRRTALSDLMAFDRSALRKLPWVHDTERACAIWASQEEGGGEHTIAHGKRLAPGTNEWTILHAGVPQAQPEPDRQAIHTRSN